MKILFCGDVVGRSGRTAIDDHLPRLKKDLNLDFIVVNGENAAGGFGITDKICEEMYGAGANVITTGNHLWGQKDLVKYIDKDPNLLRPINFPEGTPGKGAVVYQLADGRNILVIHALTRLFMELSDNPFFIIDKLLNKYSMGKGKTVQAILVDFHGEATSEKMAMGQFLDGRASLVVGTHTHIPTADAHILDEGTAYMTDAGMCGDYNSVIGMEKHIPIQKFTKRIPTERMSPAMGEGTLCGVYVETDDATGFAKEVRPIRIGGVLQGAN